MNPGTKRRKSSRATILTSSPHKNTLNKRDSDVTKRKRGGAQKSRRKEGKQRTKKNPYAWCVEIPQMKTGFNAKPAKNGPMKIVLIFVIPSIITATTVRKCVFLFSLYMDRACLQIDCSNHVTDQPRYQTFFVIHASLTRSHH